jgi:hypothetical protein
MKIVIAGSRNFFDKQKIYNIIDTSGFKIIEVVSGGSVGVDKIAEDWAIDHNVPIKSFLKESTAPFIRNELMAKYSDGLIAIWKDKSLGTYHMIECMRHFDKPIKIIEV